jgi:hypothetical protein
LLPPRYNLQPPMSSFPFFTTVGTHGFVHRYSSIWPFTYAPYPNIPSLFLAPTYIWTTFQNSCFLHTSNTTWWVFKCAPQPHLDASVHRTLLCGYPCRGTPLKIFLSCCHHIKCVASMGKTGILKCSPSICGRQK